MARTPARAKKPTAKAIRAAEEHLDELALYEFATGAMFDLIAELGPLKDPEMTVRAYIAAQADLIDWDQESADPFAVVDEQVPFAAFLVLLAGRPAVESAIAAEAHSSQNEQCEVLAGVLATALAMPPLFPDAAPAMPPAEAARMAGDLVAAALKGGEEGIWMVCNLLRHLPERARRPVVEAVIDAGGDRPGFADLAAVAALTPMGDHAQARFLDWLERSGGADGAWFLGELGRGPRVAKKPSKAFAAVVPLAWPVFEARASVPDGSGSQGLMIARTRPDKQLALFSAVVNDMRGTAMGMSDAAVSKKEYRLLVETVGAAMGELVTVPAGYALHRLAEGDALARSLGVPLPADVESWRYLLTGLEADGELAEPREAEEPEPEAIEEACELMRRPYGRSWMLDRTPATKPFFDKAVSMLQADETFPGAYDMKAILALDAHIGVWLERLFPAGVRALWHNRLMEAARVLTFADEPDDAVLAEAAAWAIAPESGVPLKDQELAVALARQAVFGAMPEPEAIAEEDEAMLRTLAQMLKRLK